MITVPSHYAKEERLKIPTPNLDCLVIAGYASFSTPNFIDSMIQGNPDDDFAEVSHTVHMVVGPNWKSVRDVCPIVARAGFGHTDSDEADATGYEINGCTWEVAPNPAPNGQTERIRLIVELTLRGGGASWITKLAYHVTVLGTLVTTSR